jgi:competence CoiA-like predicted nuclease
MPLCALDGNGIRIIIANGTEEEKQKIAGMKTSFSCPACKKEMSFVKAKTRIIHFRHKSECPYSTEPESQKHIEMKMYFLRMFPGAVPEQVIGNRIADVLIPDKGISIECQCSPISEEEIIQRTLDHNKVGYSVLWVLGNRKLEELAGSMRSKMFERELHKLAFGQVHYYFSGGLLCVKLHGKYQKLDENYIWQVGFCSRCWKLPEVSPANFSDIEKYVYAPNEKFAPEVITPLRLVKINPISKFQKIWKVNIDE